MDGNKFSSLSSYVVSKFHNNDFYKLCFVANGTNVPENNEIEKKYINIVYIHIVYIHIQIV